MSRRGRRGGGSASFRLARHATTGLWGLVRESRLVSSHPGQEAPTRPGARARNSEPERETDHLASDEDRAQELRVLAEDEGPRLGELIITYRRELAPLGAAMAVAVAASVGHQQAPGRWPLALLAGGLGTIAWHFRAERPVERLYGAGVGLLASALLAIGWAVDIAHLWFGLVLVVATAVAGLPWWRHHLSRGKLLAGRRTPKTMREQARAVVAAWPDVAEARAIAGVRLQQVVPDDYGWSMKVRIPTTSKLTVRSIVAAADGLATSFRTSQGGVRVEPVPDRADLAVIRVNVRDPLAKPIPYPGPSGTSIAAPLRIGVLEDRSELTIRIPGGHWLMGGATGSGKSFSQRVLLAELFQREDVIVWGCDVAKAGLRFLPFVDALGRLAKEPQEAVSMLQAALAIQRARAIWMGAERIDEWPLSPTHPLLAIVIDELSDLLTDPVIQELLEALTKLGREQAICLIGATQRASADAMGDSAVARANFTGRIALKCRERGDGDLILGKGMSAEGWRPDRLTLPGHVLVYDDEHQSPRPGRTYLMQTAEAQKLADRVADGRPVLDEVSAAAMAEVDAKPAPAAPTRRGVKQTARARVLATVGEAGGDGISGPDLVALLDGDVAKPTVYRVLNQLQGEGLVERDELGAWHTTA